MNVAIILCMKYVEFALVRILAVLLVKCGYVCIRITYFPMMRVPCVSIVIVAYGGRARVYVLVGHCRLIARPRVQYAGIPGCRLNRALALPTITTA